MALLNMKISCFRLVITFAMSMTGCQLVETESESGTNVNNGLQTQPQPTQPNIVFIMLDDWGWQDAGFMGSKYYQTPHLDKLAKTSFRFNQAYSSSPNCAPTRASFMSGQYPQRTGIYTVSNPARGKAEQRKLIPSPNETVLADEVVTLAESLQQAGYHTAFMGKWHLGEGDKGGPLTQGFDINIGGIHKGSPRSYFSPYKNKTISNGPDGEYLPDRLSQEAVKYIEQDRDKPFFLFLSHYAVHTPIKAPAASVAHHSNRQGDKFHKDPIYAAMIEHSDNSIANVLNALERQGLSDNTWVVITSDNGGFGGITQAPDLRGAKGMMYEGGVRVPLLIKAPEQQQQVVIEQPVSTLDFYPTLLAMAYGKVPESQPLDGDNLMPLLQQGEGEQKFERDALYFHFPAYLQHNKKAKGSSLWRATPSSMVRKGDYKLIEYFEYGQLELFNLANDQKETTNLALIEPEKTAELYLALKQWRKETNAPVPTELNPKFDNKYQLSRHSFVTWQQVKEKLAAQN